MLPFDQLSFWEKSTYIDSIDYLIVGSGIVGLSTAIELKSKYPRARIVILERGYLPTGASTKNAGFSCFGSPSELLDDLSHTPKDKIIATVRLRWEGLQLLQGRISPEKLNFDACGSFDLFTAQEETEYKKCVAELEHLNALIEEAIGLTACYRVAKPEEFAQFKGVIGAIFNQYEGKINTGSTLNELLRLAIEKGIQVLNGISVSSLHPDSKQPMATTNYGELQAKKIIVCTNGFASTLFPNEPVEPARAQVVVTSPIPNLKLPSTYHYDKGYYYFRTVDDNRILIGGARNADFKGERTMELTCTEFILNHIKSMLCEIIVPDTPFEIAYQWAGIMGVGSEKYPIIKEVSPGILAGIRLGGMGVAMGSAVGKKIAELC
jgi:gamma-glutamylputrescine oxidase